MSPEQLLKSRIKVITDYPDCPYAVGSVIQIEKDQEGDQYLAVSGYIVYYPEKYPHLFEPIPWWKDRNEKHLPKFL